MQAKTKLGAREKWCNDGQEATDKFNWRKTQIRLWRVSSLRSPEQREVNVNEIIIIAVETLETL